MRPKQRHSKWLNRNHKRPQARAVGLCDTNLRTDIAISGYPSNHRAVLGTFVLPETSEYQPDIATVTATVTGTAH